MMNLVGMGIFARVAEAKSFSGAARRLGLSKSLDDEVIWQAVLGGLGVSILPTFTVGEDLQSGRLQAVLADHSARAQSLRRLFAEPSPLGESSRFHRLSAGALPAAGVLGPRLEHTSGRRLETGSAREFLAGAAGEELHKRPAAASSRSRAAVASAGGAAGPGSFDHKRQPTP